MTAPVPFQGTARFSDCGRYRYTLARDFYQTTRSTRRITFVMLNPSTADASENDPTVAKCCRYAVRWGYGHLTVVNLFAWRATDPRELRAVDAPIGNDNDAHILDAVADSEITICAWGAHGALRDRGRNLRRRLVATGYGDRLHVLKLNRDGNPSHPLYLLDALDPSPWAQLAPELFR